MSGGRATLPEARTFSADKAPEGHKGYEGIGNPSFPLWFMIFRPQLARISRCELQPAQRRPPSATIPRIHPLGGLSREAPIVRCDSPRLHSFCGDLLFRFSLGPH